MHVNESEAGQSQPLEMADWSVLLVSLKKAISWPIVLNRENHDRAKRVKGPGG